MDNSTFSEFLRDPNKVIGKLRDNRSVVLERRDAPPLVLSLKSRQEEASLGSEVVAHFLVRVLASTPPPMRHQMAEIFGDALIDKLPWVRLLPVGDRETFVREFLEMAEASASVGNIAPLANLVHQWRATADIYADPELAAELKRPLPAGSGSVVPRPRKTVRTVRTGTRR